ncbi:peptidylprolyl isomerase [Rubellimicrobium roseum]|uniref:Parvulin-like PPIase n=1 Tax=Rubellimicrobium roseum TaxID=687525 RepID=A0A5C4NF33_9RHOB|nr:peptidylprolyl isomerase [Rubellimicrobium roseum]TNC73371.1 peptidylprolyl isomerase [Rubellimicrobium roseum]
MSSGSMLRAVGLAILLGAPAAAQDGLFSPVIVVNDRAVTGYEIAQRIRLLEIFNTPGNLDEVARTQLVEERLKQQELERRGVALAPEGLQRAIDDFAARTNLSGDAFVAQLESQGVSYETLRDYLEINVTWRDYIRSRFGSQVELSEAEIDQALAQQETQSQGIEVLLNEIVIPAPPGQEGEADALARRLSQTTSTAEFEAAAREVSAVRSREQGGRLDWTPITNYPEPLQDLLLSLDPGEVTPPLQVTGAVALLQLRDLRQGAVPAAEPELVDYAVVRIAGGLTEPALAEASRIAAAVDTCAGLFEQGIPDANIERATVAPAALPQDVALDLARLDPGEITWGRTENGGQTLLLTMLCARTYPLPEGAADREAVANTLRGDRLQGYADAIVADLRASATIVGE